MAGIFLWRGLAQSTRRNYDTPRRRFITFCALRGLRHNSGNCLPATAQWLIEWISALAGQVKAKTIKLYLCGLKSHHVDLGLPTSAFLDVRLERVIRGFKHEHAEPGRRARSPLTRDCLLKVLRYLWQPTYKNATLRAAFTLAFASFLQIGEFTYSKADLDLGPNFRNWFLTRSSVRVSRDLSHMSVHLPASKTDPFRQGVEIIIAASKDEACPIVAMVNLQNMDQHRHPLDPLFIANCHRRLPFTREYVVSNLHTLATAAGMGGGTWNGHSFRRGAATWAAEAGIPEVQIQALGRWSSSAYKSYIETSREDRITLSRRFQRSYRR